jgi:hypothetical protein
MSVLQKLQRGAVGREIGLDAEERDLAPFGR